MKTDRHIKIWDNGGTSFDRYLVKIDRYFFHMSHNASSPQGVNQFLGNLGEIQVPPNDTEVSLADLPESVQRAIRERI